VDRRASDAAGARGDRRVWLTGGLVLLVGLVGVLLALAQPREQVTGSNSVGVRGQVALVQPGERLCVRGFSVSDGTGVVRIAAGWDGLRAPAWRAVLSGPGFRHAGALPGRDAIADPDLHDRIDIPIGEVDLPADDVPARVCVTPVDVAAKIGGTAGLQGDQPAPRIDGRPLESRVALWLLAPTGDRTSLLTRLPDAFDRAVLFRPGPVTAWWYAIGFALLAPLLWLAALRLMATRSAGVGGVGRTALAIAAVAFANAAFWAILTPSFQGPDEPEHFAFAQSLAERGVAPDKDEDSDRPPFSSRAILALDGVRTYSQVGLAGVRPPWLAADEDRWRERQARVPTRADDGGGFLFPASPHGPGYYALTVPAYAAGGEDTFAQLAMMRLVSALLAALAAACAFLTLRELAPRQLWLATAAGLLVAFQPQFGFVGGTVNSDNGVNAAAALLIFLLVRGLRRGLSVPLAASIGATLVAVHVTKGTGSALFPAALVGIFGMAWRHHARRDLPAYGVLAGVAVAVQGAWALLASSLGSKPFTTAGGSAGPGLTGTVERMLEHLSTFASYVWQFFLPRLPFMADLQVQAWPAYDVYLVGGWAAFGWLTVRFPEWVYVTIAVVSGVMALLAVAAVARERLAARVRGWEIAVLLVALGSVVIGVAAVHFTPTVRGVPAEQGRYLFTAIVPLAAIAVGATLAFGRERAPLAATVLVAATIVLSYASQLLTLTTFFA
jgi:4-amino-4-deoxy-L-arabinose transferase-like glycosyltransferase